MDKCYTWYMNYRCRKCGQLVYTKEKCVQGCTASELVSSIEGTKGKLATSKTHRCLAGMQEDEYILCDLVSISKTPLKGAVEV